MAIDRENYQRIAGEGAPVFLPQPRVLLYWVDYHLIRSALVQWRLILYLVPPITRGGRTWKLLEQLQLI